MDKYLLHLVSGSTGAGKTTYARQLADRIAGVRFSIDEWMTQLFWMDTPQPLSAEWSLERVARCQGQIWATAQMVAARGVPCILDVGLTQVQHRAHFARLGQQCGWRTQLHFVDVPADERWRRVEQRNTQTDRTGQLPFAVTRDLFDFVESMWEPPTAQEMREYDGIHIT